MEALSQPISAEPSQYRQEFVQRLDILRTSERFCDVTITAKGKEFKAHRAVLAAASPFFLTLLTSDMRESNEQLIRIELEEATAPVMEDVFKYVYTGNVSITEERAHNLIATADYLFLPSLKAMAENFLKQVITTENCIFSYYFANRYQCIELKENSRDVINSNFSVVIETEDFLKLDVEKVMEWVSSDDVTVSAEEEVFKGIVKWVSYKTSEREQYLPELLHQVRVTSVSRDFLLNELAKEELITKNTELGLNFVLDILKIILSGTDEQVKQQPRKCLEKHKDGIFVFGGRKALCYFPQHDAWYRLADTLFDHKNQSLAHWKSNVCIGGICNVGESQVMEYYVPPTNSWGTIQREIDETNFTCCVVLKGDLYAVYFQSIFEGRIFRYDTERNCWSKMMDPPKRQGFSPCVVADEQYLYVIGGFLQGICLSTTTRFDPSNNKWEETAVINEARYYAFGAAMNGKVFMAGGRKSRKKSLSSCEVYNPSTDEWQLIPSLKVPRFGASMVPFKGRLYVVGGMTCHQDNYLRVLTVEEFDPERNEWKEKSAIPVKRFETAEEEKKETQFQACSARLYKGVINNLKPLNY